MADQMVTVGGAISHGTPVQAEGATLSISRTGTIEDGMQISIAGVTYTFVDALSSPAVPNEVKIDATPETGQAATLTRLGLAVVAHSSAISGGEVSQGTVENPLVLAAVVEGVLLVTAKVFGTRGNGIPVVSADKEVLAIDTDNASGVTAGGIDGTYAPPGVCTLMTDGYYLYAAFNGNNTDEYLWQRVPIGVGGIPFEAFDNDSE